MNIKPLTEMKRYDYLFEDGAIVSWFNKPMPKREKRKNILIHGTLIDTKKAN